MTNFFKDLKPESVVGEWLVDHFWNKFGGRRNYDAALQKKGVDVVLKAKSRDVYVDEKIKNQNSINAAPIGCPSVEIISNADNPQLSGWWVKPEEKTDLYAFLNLSAQNQDYYSLEYDQIDAVEVMLFSRGELKQWQRDVIKDDREIFRDAVALLKSDDDRIRYDDPFGHWCGHLRKSRKNGQLVVNLVLDRDVIKNLPFTKIYVVAKDGFTRVK